MEAEHHFRDRPELCWPMDPGKLLRCLQLPTRQRAKQGLWLRATVPGVGLPVLAPPVPWPSPSAACSGRNLTCHSPASWPSALMKHLMYTQGCSYEMELVGEHLKCTYSLRHMLLTLLDASGCTVCEVSRFPGEEREACVSSQHCGVRIQLLGSHRCFHDAEWPPSF